MAEFKKDGTKRMLGRQPHTCKICGAQGDFETYLAREMMRGIREEFVYFACGQCNCLQIAKIPENLEAYYGSEYYSMGQQEDIEFENPVLHWQKVLDVGCGSGSWLVQKARAGWGNLYGCDPFLDHDRHYGDRVHIRSCSLHEMEGDGSFDVIRMHDSFGRMPDPMAVLKSARRLLKADGLLTMTIPVYPNIAFEKYGPHWYQLDAPRHIFLYSKKSLEWLAKKAGLTVTGWKFQSDNSQFVRSFFYQNGIPYYEQERLVKEYFSEKDLAGLTLEAGWANEKEYGDYAAVNLAVGELPEEEGGSRVIYQCFRREKSRYAYPYPPVYREPNTDYICFTMENDVESGHWRIRRVADLEPETLEPYLREYEVRRELEQDRIQMGSLFGTDKTGCAVTVLSLEELPHIKLDTGSIVPTADGKGSYKYEKNPIYQKGKYQGRPLLLTIGVPVSNQIETIERCLSHIKPLLEKLDAELVVIDTGSTDGTVEVCRSYGARVYERPWDNNMSAARNEAIRHARGLWYMSIDDDEWFEDVDDILWFFQSGKYRKYCYATYVQRNYMDSEGRIYENYHTLRMAEITPELHFEGRIHDALAITQKNGGYQLNSYAHHYGFVSDRKDKRWEKFMRNASILLLDSYEYPEDTRYIFQMANEYKGIRRPETALPLFVQCFALAKERGDLYRARTCATEVISCLYDMGDERIFTWAVYLEENYGLITVEKAFSAWARCNQAFIMSRPVLQVLACYDRYEELLEEYQKDASPEKVLAFYGLQMVEHDYYIMDAEAIGFYACLKVGQEDRALEILKRFSLDTVENKRNAVLLEGMAAGDPVYYALCEKLTPQQWEDWKDIILGAFMENLKRDGRMERMLERMPGLLSRISVPSVLDWQNRSQGKWQGRAWQKLLDYAMGQVTEDSPLQVLALCTGILKRAYMERCREESERLPVDASQEDAAALEKNKWDSGAIFYEYVTVTGVFAERYYTGERLLDEDMWEEIPAETRAVYRMALALMDGRANSENIALLKQALNIFPDFHKEIRSILTGLL